MRTISPGVFKDRCKPEHRPRASWTPQPKQCFVIQIDDFAELPGIIADLLIHM
jgi:hypothetical protein